MSGYASRIAAAAILLVAATPADEPTMRRGAAIYNGSERSPNWRAYSADGDYAYPIGTVSCAACHGEDGTGASEGGVAAPSLAVARTMDGPDLLKWLSNAFAGKGRDGAPLDDRMPLFEISTDDVRALAAFLQTLPLPYRRGVAVDAVHIRIDTTGASLSVAAIDTLRRRGKGLASGMTLFGRTPRLAVISNPADGDREAGPFISIGWGPNGASDVPVSVQVVDETGSGRCGSLLPDAERRYRLLEQWMSRRHLTPARNGSIVTVQHEAGRPVGPFGSTKFDLAAQRPSTGPSSVPVIAGDLAERMRSVEDIEAETELRVHEASAVSLFLNALRVSLAGLSRSGRRLSATAVCDAIQSELARQHAITLLFEHQEYVIHASD